MENLEYKHLDIEEKWRSHWYEDNVYEAIDFSPKPKKYILAELPYPSGKYLHAGHMMRYTVPEVYSRFLRMRGYNVLFPMGWDCFGLPAETYALKTKTTPQKAIAQAIKDYKFAMQRMGYAIDWNREINTSDPNFYKWTQWMFLKLYEKGLVELREMPVWWCAALGVLADEEVITKPDGSKVSERDSHPVERKMLKQWVLKITDYADRLLEDLDKTDYLDYVKQGQINWIGKKEGALVNFETNINKTLSVFTTRPDTLYGVTFLAICPEHPLMEYILVSAVNQDQIKQYSLEASKKSDIERLAKTKTGIKVEGVHVQHPITGEIVPLFVADYVLLDYGTGVVMGVPGHDGRDNDFAKSLGLPIIEVIKKPQDFTENVYTGDGELINSGEYTGKQSKEFKTEIVETLQKQNKASFKTTYKLRDTIWSRQRYWGEPIPLLYTQDDTIEQDLALPVTLPEITEFDETRNEFPLLAEFEEWVNVLASAGHPAKRETDVMPTWAGSNWYYIRYLDPNNEDSFADMEKMKYWLPVDNYFGDAGHTTAHLLYTRFWYKALYDMGYMPFDEPIKWRMSGGILLGEDQRKMSKSRPEYSVDPAYLMESFGADATRMVLCFLGPYSETYPWNSNSIRACYKVIDTIYGLKSKVVADQTPNLDQPYHQLVQKVTSMLENLKMNTAVSEIMIFVNECKKAESINIDLWKGFIKVIAPIVPFVAEDLWFEVNGYPEWKRENSVHLQSWPEFDQSKAQGSSIDLPVQINGKTRAIIKVGNDLTQEQIEELVFQTPEVIKFCAKENVKKVIFVPGKILNIIC
jgi:leucyl-tRNA synthetase